MCTNTKCANTVVAEGCDENCDFLELHGCCSVWTRIVVMSGASPIIAGRQRGIRWQGRQDSEGGTGEEVVGKVARVRDG